jgi:hypothetical protein
MKSQMSRTKTADQYTVYANGIPEHKTGPFPNRGNPNRIQARHTTYFISASPKQNNEPTALRMGPFGIAVNGVPFDPGAAEWYNGVRSETWQYEPLSGAIELGLDANYAHVQPNGAYHYHGLPSGLLKSLGVTPGKHSPLVGWAADGFPVYALYGYSIPDDPNSNVIELKSSYHVKKGNRPSDSGAPGGHYDGTFIGDYEFTAGDGPLDDCNGRFCVTPEFPKGTYAYFLTDDWPVIPRKFKGTPSSDLQREGPGPGTGGDRRPPPPHSGPPPRF